MPVVTRKLSISVSALFCISILSHVGLASGGVVPLPRDSTPMVTSTLNESAPASAAVPSNLFEDSLRPEAVVPVVELAPAPTHASAPAAVPLPPALEQGLSGGAALILAAGFRKLRRTFRRGF